MTDGISQAAQDINKAHHQAFENHRSSESFYRQAAINSVWQLQPKYSIENWDNEGASAVSIKTLLAANAFISRLPSELPSPTVLPEPDGQIELEWYVSPSCLLSVSIDPEGRIFWASVIGNESTRGEGHFREFIPPTVIHLIGRVFTS